MEAYFKKTRVQSSCLEREKNAAVKTHLCCNLGILVNLKT